MTSIEEYFQNFWSSIPNLQTMPIVPITEAFSAYLDIDISGDSFEVPVVLVPYAVHAKGKEYNRLVFTLINGADEFDRRTIHKKTINTILREFSVAIREKRRLAHVITSKNLHYYGCHGMIFDGNYSPLLLATINVQFGPDGEVLLSNPKCKISYKVFERSPEIVEKTIIKQAIPWYAHNFVDVCYSGRRSHNVPVEVSICQLDSLIVRPKIPTPSSTNMEDFNNTIATCYDIN